MLKQSRIGPAPRDAVEMMPSGLQTPGVDPGASGLKASLQGAPLQLQSSSDPQPHAAEPKKAAAQKGLLNAPQKDALDNAGWCGTIAGLLCICAILLFLIILMSYKVNKLVKKSEEERELWHWKSLTLIEILKDIQIGKVPKCGICKVQWVQQAEKCFFFREGKMGWHSSMGFCREEHGSLATAFETVKMDFLRFYSSKYYHLDSDKFWIGLLYNTTQGKWTWADGTPFISLPYVVDLDHKGCVYIQNGKLYSQNCSKVAKLICERKVQFGWS